MGFFESVGQGLLGTAASTIGGLFLSNQQQKQNEQLWNMQNEYNKPINQIRRLREAGLNPAALLAKGSVDNVNSSPPQSADMASGMSAASESLLNSLTMSNLKEQNKNLKMQNEVLKEDARSKSLDNDLKEAENQDKIARANEMKEFYDEYIGLPKPDTSGNWENRNGYWYDIDSGRVANRYDYNMSDDEFKLHNRRRQSIKFDFDTQSYQVHMIDLEDRMKIIRWAIEDTYGIKTADLAVKELEQRIDNMKKQGELYGEQTTAIQLDNDMFKNLGIGSKTADMILRLIIKCIR